MSRSAVAVDAESIARDAASHGLACIMARMPSCPATPCRLSSGIAARGQRAAAGALLMITLAASTVATAQQAAVPAGDDTLGFHVGASESLHHDSNFYDASAQQSSIAVVGQTESTSSVTGSFHQIYGREDVSASATVGRVLFNSLGQFNFTQLELREAVKASLPLSVVVNADADRSSSLAHFADLVGPNGLPVSARDVIITNRFHGMIDFPFESNWRGLIEGTETHSSNSYGLLSTQDARIHALDGGVRFQPVTGNHVDLLIRSEIGEFPNGSPSVEIGPGYHDRGVDLRVDWTFSGASHVLGHAGFMRRAGDDLYVIYNGALTDINRNFSGPAVDLSFIWQITGTTGVTFYIARQAGAAGDYNFLSAVTKTLRITPNYKLTSKIQLEAFGEWDQRNYFSQVYSVINNEPAGTIRDDISTSVGMRGRWNPFRWLQTSLEVRRDARSSTLGVWSYTDNSATLAVQATF